MREKLIQLRYGTRAELNASVADWEIGEPGFITDERKLVIADKDDTTDNQDFVEIADGGGGGTGGTALIGHGFTTTPFDNITIDSRDETGYQSFYSVVADVDGSGEFGLVGYGLDKLTKLFFDGDSSVSDGNVLVVGLPELESLGSGLEADVGGLDGAISYAQGFETLTAKDCPNLKYVYLVGSENAGDGLTGDGIVISNCPSLEIFGMNGFLEVTGVSISGSFPNLYAVALTNVAAFTIDSLITLMGQLPDRTGKTAGELTLSGNAAVAGAGYAAAKLAVEAKNWTVVDS
jgi:hypothetical protein